MLLILKMGSLLFSNASEIQLGGRYTNIIFDCVAQLFIQKLWINFSLKLVLFLDPHHNTCMVLDYVILLCLLIIFNYV